MKRMKRPDPNPVKVEERGVRSDPVPALERIAKNLEEKKDASWHETWWGVLLLTFIGGIIVAFVVWKFGWL